ncbi:MAG: hypothetical protein ABII72_03030 [Parcubacteria group bacterium]
MDSYDLISEASKKCYKAWDQLMGVFDQLPPQAQEILRPDVENRRQYQALWSINDGGEKVGGDWSINGFCNRTGHLVANDDFWAALSDDLPDLNPALLRADMADILVPLAEILEGNVLLDFPREALSHATVPRSLA